MQPASATVFQVTAVPPVSVQAQQIGEAFMRGSLQDAIKLLEATKQAPAEPTVRVVFNGPEVSAQAGFALSEAPGVGEEWEIIFRKKPRLTPAELDG